MRILAFDPGVHHVGWASLEEGRLMRCGLVRESKDTPLYVALGARFDDRDLAGVEVVIERPQIYKQAQWKGDPNDLIDLAMVAGVLGYLCRRGAVACVRPHAWKGSAKKTAVHAWIRKRLDAEELAIVDAVDVPPSLRHNVLDAIGIGLWKAGRL